MRICFFIGDITHCGGTEKVACQIMNGLSERNEVSVISLAEESDHLFYELPQRIRRFVLFDSMPNGMKQYAQIVLALRQKLKNMDVLIDVDTILDAFSVPALFGLKTKLISWEHFNFEESMGNRFRVPIRRLFTKHADCIVTLTKEDQQTYRRYLGNKKTVVQIYNPVVFPTNCTSYQRNSKTIVSVGRLAKQKGFDYLVEVAENVLNMHTDWEWLVLGEGEERAKLEKMKNERNISRLAFIGQVEDVYSYLQKSSIFVMTSRFEGFPLALIEAKAARLPAVSFNCKTGPSELIEDGVNGYLVNCYDTGAMAEKLIELIENEKKRASFSDNSTVNIDELLPVYVIKRWEEILRNLNIEKTVV